MANLQDFVQYADAVKLFIEAGFSESTFRRKVKEHPIRTTMPEGRSRGAWYSKKDIEEVIAQAEKGNQRTENNQEPAGATDWIQERDLPYVLALDLEMYGIENTVDISITHSWWKKNPYACRILYDKRDRRNIWGVLTIMPLKEETIFRLLRDELKERELTANDILAYEPGNTYTGYIASASVRPDHRAHIRELIESVFRFWCEQYPQIQLTKLYAFAVSDEGIDLIKHLFFSPRYDIGENAFELNPLQRNPSKMLRAFQDCIQRKKADSNLSSLAEKPV